MLTYPVISSTKLHKPKRPKKPVARSIDSWSSRGRGRADASARLAAARAVPHRQPRHA